jgi:hypothetical protein
MVLWWFWFLMTQGTYSQRLGIKFVNTLYKEGYFQHDYKALLTRDRRHIIDSAHCRPALQGWSVQYQAVAWFYSCFLHIISHVRLLLPSRKEYLLNIFCLSGMLFFIVKWEWYRGLLSWYFINIKELYPSFVSRLPAGKGKFYLLAIFILVSTR